MVYGLLLLTVCARVDLKYTSVFVGFVRDLLCDVVPSVCFVCVALCLGGLGV